MSYKIVYDPWWFSNGCDCCEDTEMESWAIEGLEEPRSSGSLEEALLLILEQNGIKVEIDYEAA